MTRSSRLSWLVGLGALVVAIGAPRPSLAQTARHVPDDYASVQAAVDAADAGDTILVGSGAWCGATITKRLVVRGEGDVTITGNGCTGPIASAPAPGIAGFLLLKTSTSDPSGTTIEHFTFSDVYTGINALAVGDVIVQHNMIQPRRAGVFSRNGSNWTVAYNTVDNRAAGFPNSGIVNVAGNGWTIVHNDVLGTWVGISVTRGSGLAPRASNNTVSFNHIEGGLDGEAIGLAGQDGAIVTNNNLFVPTSDRYVGDPALCGGWGILLYSAGSSSRFLTSINSTITNNDTRDTQVGVYVLLDPSGNPGNADGLLLRGNFGTLALNQPDTCEGGPAGAEITGLVKSRAISTLIECDGSGDCQ
jgi:copper-binding protein NosD